MALDIDIQGGLQGAATGASFGGMAGMAIGGGLGILGGTLANQASQRAAREQMQFQENMSSSAHQREVRDLRAAGLNPILSATHGGASTPSGSTYTAQNVAQGAVSSALEVRRIKDQLDNIRADTRVKDAERVLYSQKFNESQQATAKLLEETKGVSADNALREVDESLYRSRYGAALRFLEKTLGAAGQGARLLQDLPRSSRPTDKEVLRRYRRR